MPDRVLRQFGFVQVIPVKVYEPSKCCRGPQNMKYVCVHDNNTRPFETWVHHCLKLSKLGTYRATYVTEVVHGYMKYYLDRTHLRIMRSSTSSRRKVQPSEMSHEAVSGVICIGLK